MKRNTLMLAFAATLLFAGSSFASAGNSSQTNPGFTTMDAIIQWVACTFGYENSCNYISNTPVIINR